MKLLLKTKRHVKLMNQTSWNIKSYATKSRGKKNANPIYVKLATFSPKWRHFLVDGRKWMSGWLTTEAEDGQAMAVLSLRWQDRPQKGIVNTSSFSLKYFLARGLINDLVMIASAMCPMSPCYKNKKIKNNRNRYKDCYTCQ